MGGADPLGVAVVASGRVAHPPAGDERAGLARQPRRLGGRDVQPAYSLLPALSDPDDPLSCGLRVDPGSARAAFPGVGESATTSASRYRRLNAPRGVIC